MSAPVQCFMIEQTDRVRLSLRRYRSSEAGRCALPWGYHDASTVLGEAPAIITERGNLDVRPETFADDDARWPTQCACGEAFVDSDERQVFQDAIYRRADTGEERPLREWQRVPGAMWNAFWVADVWPGPDGLSLVVALPGGGEWNIDGPAKNDGRPWSRTGKPPRITARPSILTPTYHGWLTDGVLTSC